MNEKGGINFMAKKINRNALIAAVKSSKTPIALKKGLIRKYPFLKKYMK